MLKEQSLPSAQRFLWRRNGYSHFGKHWDRRKILKLVSSSPRISSRIFFSFANGFLGLANSICGSVIFGKGAAVARAGFTVFFQPASPKAKAGIGVQSLRPSVRPKILSSQLLWNYWSDFHETWNVHRTAYVVMHIGRKFWSPHFCGSYALWNLENTHKWPCHRNSSETTDPIFMKLGM